MCLVYMITLILCFVISNKINLGILPKWATYTYQQRVERVYPIIPNIRWWMKNVVFFPHI